MKHTCEECGEKGFHWLAAPMSLMDIMTGNEKAGVWTCAKFYDPVTKRRIGV